MGSRTKGMGVESFKILDSNYGKRILDSQGRSHNHAFVSSPQIQRTANVVFERGQSPVISAGLGDLRVLKTTQTAFKNFVDDEFRSLPDADDRLFSTVVTGDWVYSRVVSDFDEAFETVREAILRGFAGPADVGVFSPSVQNTQNIIQKDILNRIPEIEKISLSMPNAHYFDYDFSKFPKLKAELEKPGLGSVYYPVDKPSGMIVSTLARGQLSKLVTL